MKPSQSPSLTRFLSDFTLGFSDGLTVPFALTAGLSSLGRSDTVVYAGLAELCAGSISMGIGGYLAAKDEMPQNYRPGRCQQDDDADDEELKGMLRDDIGHGEKVEDGEDEGEDLIRRHLEPLDLPAAMVSEIMANLQAQPGSFKRAAMRLESHSVAPFDSPSSPAANWPVASGLSISLGYAIGGAVPLLPYFIAATVGAGLCWSAGLCLVTLFAFGSGKSWVLQGGREARWQQCLWDGLQMLVLGTVAAGAAIVCVRMLGGSAGGNGD